MVVEIVDYSMVEFGVVRCICFEMDGWSKLVEMKIEVCEYTYFVYG